MCTKGCTKGCTTVFKSFVVFILLLYTKNKYISLFIVHQTRCSNFSFIHIFVCKPNYEDDFI